MTNNRVKVKFVGFVIFLAVASLAFAGWQADPLSWTEIGGRLSCRNSGFALVDGERGRVVSISAKVIPETCDNPSWAVIGTAVYDDAANFWHLALVKRPANQRSRHTFELAMMQDGRRPVQGRLMCLECKTFAAWEFGREYDLDLRMDRTGVRGEVRDGTNCLYRAAYRFTAPAADRGVPALHVAGNLKGVFRDVRHEVSDAMPRTIPPVDGQTLGFVRVTERDGRWTALDTNGVPFTVLGIDHVHPWGMFCEKLGYSPYGRAVQARYRDWDAWADDTVGRLKAWGFNALGAGCDVKRLGHRGFYHTEFLNMGQRLCDDEENWFIRKYDRAPCTAFPNVFHPEFPKACDWVARERCAKGRDDPWLWGYFIDNELAWWGEGDLDAGLFDLVMKKSDDHPAKRALVEFIAGRSVTPEVKREFLALAADRYFAATTAAIRKYDPNHLVLGCRFAGFGGAHDVVWQAAAKYCDVITFNCYPWVDLDRNVVLDRKGGVPIRKKFDEFYAKVKKPLLVTEWSFPALDTGRPCYFGAGQRFATQAERTRATLLFARTLLGLPYFIGYDYFMWCDQPALGLHEKFKEDSNYGLVREDGTPHELITSMFARLQKDVDRWRVAGVPAERKIDQPGEVSACDRLIASVKGPKDAVTFSQTGNAWTLENDVGLALKGVLGPNREMVGEVAWNGRVFGSLGTMLQFATPRNWMGAREVTDVRFRRAGSCAEVFITAEGESVERRFALTMRTIVAPGERDFATEIVEVRNVGLVPLKADRIFFRPFAAERPNEEIRQVPNVWKGRTKGYWRLSDGTQYGVESTSPDAKNFCFWLGTRGEQHPDAAFVPSNSVELKPGETWHPQSPLSATVRVLRGETYSVSILGDTHFDAEPESVYHSHYDESNRWAKVQHEEFRRNGEMWRGRCRGLLAASAKLARENPTSFVLQMGDIVQGDCDDVPTHKRMLDDCIRLLRVPYPQALPFLTVVGNHDVRGKGAREAYFSFAEPFMSKELGQRVRYPVFSFLKGGDLWVFCDFETKDLSPIIETIETRPGVRHTFLVTHGPFTPAEDSFPVWRLGGSRSCDALRPKLYELLSRRRAVILSGHSHLTAYYRHENASGGFAEFTANSVWKAPELATGDSICEGAAEYGKRAAAKLTDARKTEFETATKAFRSGLRDYYLSEGAGHARLNVSESGVTVDFYPGAATLPARTFRMK